MKQPEYNEIDSLLRSWAGRERSVSGNSSDGRAGAHLDADELNSYAEGALPPATRARYTPHLVECDECRKIVAQLAVAAGPVARELVAAKPEGRGWQKALAALFAPAVMKFALPALGLIVVGVLFFATRRGSDRAAIVATPNIEKEKLNAESVATPIGSPAYSDSTSSEPAKSDAQAKKTDTKSSAAAGNKEQGTLSAESSVFVAEKKPEEPEKDRTRTEEDEAKAKAGAPAPTATTQSAAGQPSNTARPASADAPPPPKAVVAAKETAGASAGGKVLADKNESKREAPRSVVVDGVDSSDAAKPKDDDRQKAKPLSAARANVDRRDQAEDTRSLAGRRFAKHNGVWVDSNYKSSMSTVQVSRGSEQYRALIADEPEINNIANQLKGEIFLVWKGRAYHIK
ncbi:MAG TPA: zf-HC2 domain-containing protein [Pyrinomonadaceae bacterium]|nr:zf-HC2 domain-containing protein [Pyrinomonadaceae bacterium]